MDIASSLCMNTFLKLVFGCFVVVVRFYFVLFWVFYFFIFLALTLPMFQVKFMAQTHSVEPHR